MEALWWVEIFPVSNLFDIAMFVSQLLIFLPVVTPRHSLKSVMEIFHSLELHEEAVDWKIFLSNNFPLNASYRLHKLNAGSKCNKNKIVRGDRKGEKINVNRSSRCDLFSWILINFLFLTLFSYQPQIAPCYYFFCSSWRQK